MVIMYNFVLLLYYILYIPAYALYGGRMYDFAFDLLYFLTPKKDKNYITFLYAQAQQETGNFKSDLFKRAKNMFGMRVPSKRKWWGNGETNNYSSYATYMHSILDVISWYEYNYKNWEQLKEVFDLSNVKTFVNGINMKGYFTGSPVVYGANVYKYYSAKKWNTTNIILAFPLSIVIIAILIKQLGSKLWKG